MKKKGLGQPSPAEEPAGLGVEGDSCAGAAGGLLLPNRVEQEEPIPMGMATPHPGERGLWGAASSAGTSMAGPPEPPYREVARPGNVTKRWTTGACHLQQLCWQIS